MTNKKNPAITNLGGTPEFGRKESKRSIELHKQEFPSDDDISSIFEKAKRPGVDSEYPTPIAAPQKMDKLRRWFSRSNSAKSIDSHESSVFDCQSSIDETANKVKVKLVKMQTVPKLKSIRSADKLKDFIKTKRHLKAYSDILANTTAIDNAVASNEATDGPMLALWDVKRLRHKSASKKEPQVFTDSWIIREIQLQNKILPDSSFPLHMQQSFEEDIISIKSDDDSEIFSIWKVSQSPCGVWLMAGTQRGWIYLYKTCVNHPKGLFEDLPVAIFKAHEGCLVDFVWLPTLADGRPMFISIGFDRRLCLWVGSDPKPLDAVKTSEWSSSIILHPQDSTQLFLGSLDATVQLWRVSIQLDGDVVRGRASMIDYVRVPDVVTAVSISPDGQFLAVGVRRGSVAIYDSNTLRFMTEIECVPRKTRKWRSSSHRVVGLSWSADSEKFVATTHDSSIRLISLRPENGTDESRCIVKFSNHTLQYLLLKAAFINSYSGNERILMASEDNNLYCYAFENGVYSYDSIKISNQLVTSFVVSNRPFDVFLNTEIRTALLSKLGNGDKRELEGNLEKKELGELLELNELKTNREPSKDFPTLPPATNSTRDTSLRWQHPKYFGTLIGTYSGNIKVFVNFGLER